MSVRSPLFGVLVANRGRKRYKAMTIFSLLLTCYTYADRGLLRSPGMK
jgi:hypothetical protein